MNPETMLEKVCRSLDILIAYGPRWPPLYFGGGLYGEVK